MADEDKNDVVADDREEMIKEAARKLEIDIEESPEEDEAEDREDIDSTDDKDDSKEPDKASEEMVDIEGISVPKSIAEQLIAKAKEKYSQTREEGEDKRKEKEDLISKRKEIYEKIKKSALGDEALTGVADVLEQIQSDLDRRDQEAEERKVFEAQKQNDYRLIMNDRAEVEKEFGVKLPDFDSDEFKTLMKAAASVNVNRLREAYIKIHGDPKKSGEAKKFKTVDSNKDRETDDYSGLDSEFVADLKAMAKKTGVPFKNLLKHAKADFTR